MHRRLIHVLLSRRLRRAVILGATALVALTTATGLVLVGLARGSPAWWRNVRRDDPATIETARQVEESLTSVLTRGRPTDPTYASAPGVPWRSTPWSFKIRATDVNAWLNVRLRLWLANREEDFVWPEEISQLQVDFSDGRIRVGARVRVGDRDQILSATLDPAVNEDGSLSAPARWVHVGRLSIPPSWVLDAPDPGGAGYVPRELRALPETQSMFRAFLGELPVTANPVIKLDGGRRVRILGVQSADGALVVHCRTEFQ